MHRSIARAGLAILWCGAAFAQFGAVDIHTSPPNTIPSMRVRFAHGRYELRNASLVDLIRTAWDVDEDKVVGGPDWLDIDRFDVIALAPPDTTTETLHADLRNLLADRFHLMAHAGTQNISAWAMTAGKKPLLVKGDGPSGGSCKIQPYSVRPVVYQCANVTMASFAKSIAGAREASGYLFGYKVVDETGLQGAWNFTLKWSPRGFGYTSSPPGETTTIFDAFEKQLGLKLERTKLAVPVVTVEKVNENPTPNISGITEKPPAPPSFEVAEIKPDISSMNGTAVGIFPGGRVNIHGTLKGLILEAWGDLNPHRIVGGPKSLDSTRFEVLAKAPTQEGAVAGWNGPVWNGVDLDSMRMMLRALLVERFHLKAHEENREVPGYALVSRKSKLRKADPANRPGCKDGPLPGEKDPRLDNPAAPNLTTCRNMTMTQFAAELGKVLYGFPPIVDATGISGRYDLSINFTPIPRMPDIALPGANADTPPEPDGTISIFEAVEKQLGLKLESRKVTASVLVIDSADEMPTPN